MHHIFGNLSPFEARAEDPDRREARKIAAEMGLPGQHAALQDKREQVQHHEPGADGEGAAEVAVGAEIQGNQRPHQTEKRPGSAHHGRGRDRQEPEDRRAAERRERPDEREPGPPDPPDHRGPEPGQHGDVAQEVRGAGMEPRIGEEHGRRLAGEVRLPAMQEPRPERAIGQRDVAPAPRAEQAGIGQGQVASMAMQSA